MCAPYLYSARSAFKMNKSLFHSTTFYTAPRIIKKRKKEEVSWQKEQ